MSGLKSVNNSAPQKSQDNYVQQLRDQIGSGFTDQVKQGKKRNELGKDDFMRLMTAQLKYQDPINPVKNEQMAAQLAQFSSLEQMVNVNQNLEKMAAGQRPQENILAASLIGKKIVTDQSKFNFDKKSEPTIKFDLPVNSSAATLAVLNEKGEVVRELKIGSLKQGQQTVKWDGKSDKGLDQPEGIYSFHVTAKDMEDRPIEVKTGSSGLVNGVVFEQGKALLLVDGKKIPFDTVGRIEENSTPIAVPEKNPAGTSPAAVQAPIPASTAEKNREKISQQVLQPQIKSETIKEQEQALAQDAPMPLWNPNL